MAESASLQELLTCSICLDRFTFPKVLPCMHTFCLNCLRGIAKDAATVSCPQCREQHQIPEQGIQHFKDNYVINNFLGMFGDVAKCSDCKRESNLTECGHCQQSVCGGCRLNHEQIVQDLHDKFRFVKEASAEVPDEDEKTTEKMKRLLEKIDSEQDRMPRLFDDLRRNINQAQEEASSYYDVLRTQVRAKLREEKTPLQQSMQELVSGCKSTNALLMLKTVLECTEITIAKILELDDVDKVALAYEYDVADGFGRVRCCDKMVEIGRLVAGETLPESEPNPIVEASLPCKVDYKKKQPSFGICMDVNPLNGQGILPLCAAYCASSKSVYCISEGETPGVGQVLVYGMDRADKVLSPLIQNAHDLAFTKSGKLLIAETTSVTVVDLVASRQFDNEDALLRLELSDMPSSSQICSYRDEFVILDREKKYLTFYTEEGKLLRSMRVTANKDSLMTVGKDGRIYIAFQDITKRKEGINNHYMKGCDHSRKMSYANVTVGVRMCIIPWEGGNRETFTLPVESVTYSYRYIDCPECHQTNGWRVDVSDQEILENYLLRGLCVDGDGYVCITSALEKSLIEVYTPEKVFYHRLSAPETDRSGFGELRGLSLMTDGRIIVCDYGNKRIQII